MSKNKKGRTLSMSEKHGNGNEPNIQIDGVPPDVVWDAENPPFIYECSQGTEHDSNCDGNCEGNVGTELQIQLHNEVKAWARAGMDPTSIAPDMLGMACQANALQVVLVRHGILDQLEVDEEFRKIRYDIMHNIRMEMEPQIKEMRARAIVGVVKKPGLINPFEQQ